MSAVVAAHAEGLVQSSAASEARPMNGNPRIVAALRQRFPQIVGPKAEDICYATSNRQAAVKAIAPRCQLVLVIGSPKSSNSLRLLEVAERCGATAYMVQRAADIDPAWLGGVETMGLTAGASAPEALVDEVVARIASLRDITVEKVVTTEEDRKSVV